MSIRNIYYKQFKDMSALNIPFPKNKKTSLYCNYKHNLNSTIYIQEIWNNIDVDV